MLRSREIKTMRTYLRCNPIVTSLPKARGFAAAAVVSRVGVRTCVLVSAFKQDAILTRGFATGS